MYRWTLGAPLSSFLPTPRFVYAQTEQIQRGVETKLWIQRVLSLFRSDTDTAPIAVTVTVVALVLFVGVSIWLWRRRRKREDELKL